MDRLLEISILIGSIFSCSRCHPSETSTAKGFSFQDNKYPATVKYNNPQTGCTATYLLDLEVKNCMVVQINFPNGGHLDNDHIKATRLGKKGYAKVSGEENKTYLVRTNLQKKRALIGLT